MKKDKLLQELTKMLLALIDNCAPNKPEQASRSSEKSFNTNDGISLSKPELVKDGDDSTVKHKMTASQDGVTVITTISYDLDATKKWANADMSLDEAKKHNPDATAQDLSDYKKSAEQTLDDFKNGKISHKEMREGIHGAKMKLYNMNPEKDKQQANDGSKMSPAPKPDVKITEKDENGPQVKPNERNESMADTTAQPPAPSASSVSTDKP
ncbi:MAG: hypothetical protein P1U63_00555 [Coxiellaceae bacterium]|nr:hypothetical protein [Coxiellaceae bacterium]